jgi:hypothetical protein
MPGTRIYLAGPDWIHEIKHDGYRLIVQRDGQRAASACCLRRTAQRTILLLLPENPTHGKRGAARAMYLL